MVSPGGFYICFFPGLKILLEPYGRVLHRKAKNDFLAEFQIIICFHFKVEVIVLWFDLLHTNGINPELEITWWVYV